MNPVRVIERKRDGGAHSKDEIRFIVESATDPSKMSESQLAAWCMAVVWRGMNLDETAWLTQAMVDSGERVDLAGLPKPWVDKHSTGGVGDKTTIALLPMLAACGLTCVKMSGRGLGKTGGTIDKLESIPGFRTALSIEELKSQALEIGLSLTGQTPRLTPADGALYALRDVTGTVRSIPLIASSVLSKKIAGGAEVISIDLKCGSGAFMQSLEEARELGRVMMGVAERLGVKLGIEITDMDQPLGRAVGNRLEVVEAIETLQGRGPERFASLCVELCASALVSAGLEASHESATQRAMSSISSGSALQKAGAWFAAQGAQVSPEGVAAQAGAPELRDIHVTRGGWVRRVDAGVVGEVVVDLGGGRRQKADVIDPRVGVELLVAVGDEVKAGEPWLRIHGRSAGEVDAAALALEAALEVPDSPVDPRPIVLERLA